jgi:tetratricopeptide (TPR) repeat protein
MKLSQARVALLILVVLVSTPGCTIINRIRAKNELNEAARAYKAGHFAEAEERSRRALELDPNNKNAPAFIARSIHAQYKPGVDNPENLTLARNAIEAYQRLLATNPNNEEAYKAIAYLYGALKDEPKQREWIMQRAGNNSVDAAKRSEAYVVLASQDWNCSYTITEQPGIKTTEGTKIVYKKPKEQKDYDQAVACVTRGLEEANQAISLDPNNESAWSFKTNLLLERVKFAEMDGKADEKERFQKEADDAQKQTIKLSEENERKKEAEEAKKGQKPPTS